MRYVFRARAEADVAKAVRHYDEISPQVGDAFVDRLYEVLERLSVFPESAPVVRRGGVRRAVLNQFPFGVFYVVEHRITVFRVFHLAQHPDEWPQVDGGGDHVR